MRHQRLISWMLPLAAAALLGSGASRALTPAAEPGMRGDEKIRVASVAGGPGDLDQPGAALCSEQVDPEAAARSSFPVLGPIEPIPDRETRLKEQINALGAEAVPWPEGEPSAPAPRDPAGSAPGLAAVTSLPPWLGWTVLVGGGLMAAVPAAHLLLSRRRRKATAPVAGGSIRSPEKVSDLQARAAGEPVPRDEFDAEMRRIRESILEVVQLVESIHSRIGYARGTEAGHEAAIADEPEPRGPWSDRDLSMGASSSAGVREETLHAPSTADGRDLTTIRRAVLRLAEEGWGGDRIAERLRLGHADVGLILRSGRSRAAAGGQRASWTGVN